MADTESFQLSLDTAEAYESAFVPALFEPWARIVVDAAGVREGDRVLDVACGTGIVARVAADRAGPKGSVVGIDRNPAMLAVAKRLRPDIEWREGDASGLPFLARSFDIVVCQAALMFFPDPRASLKEMARAVKDDGTVAIHVWERLQDQPAYRPFIDVAARSAGPDATDLLGSYFSRGDLSELWRLLEAGGLWPAATITEATMLRFGSVDEFVMTEVQSTPLGERLAGDAVARIIEDSREALRAYTSPDGTLDIPIRGHVITATPRARRGQLTGSSRTHVSTAMSTEDTRPSGVRWKTTRSPASRTPAPTAAPGSR
jgi:ubiquinone/menaquinone biosynthesis C-methylase UbiE